MKTNSHSNSDTTPQHESSATGSIDLSQQNIPYSGSRSSLSIAAFDDSPLNNEEKVILSAFSEAGTSQTGQPNSLQPLYNRTNSSASNNSTSSSNSGLRECVLCLQDIPVDRFPKLFPCSHYSCIPCVKQYLFIEITESRTHITCPKCTEPMHPDG